MYTPILSTLIYVFSPDQKKVLMIYRNKREHDHHVGKYNGLGGKMQRGEDLDQSMRRELFEEAGIIPLDYILKGTINWPGFGKKGEDWFGFVYNVFSFQGEPFQENSEGDLLWKSVDEVLDLDLWEGDYFFMPKILDGTRKSFHAYIPYEKGKMQTALFSENFDR